MKRTFIALYGYLIGHNAGYDDAAEAYTETYEAIIDKYKQIYESAIDELFKIISEHHEKEMQRVRTRHQIRRNYHESRTNKQVYICSYGSD